MSTKVRNGDAGDAKPEVVWATCVCCGLMEECTSAYVARVRERYGGSWVCGLCGEAVKDEIRRSGHRISTEEALSRHISFSESFRSASPPIDTAAHLITAMRQLLRRSLESPRAMRSTPNSPQREAEGEDGAVSSDATRRSLARSGSCFSTLSLIEANGTKPSANKSQDVSVSSKSIIDVDVEILEVFGWTGKMLCCF